MTLPDRDPGMAVSDAQRALKAGDHRFLALRIAGELAAPGLAGVAVEVGSNEAETFNVLASLTSPPDSTDFRASRLLAYVTAYNQAILAEVSPPRRLSCRLTTA